MCTPARIHFASFSVLYTMHLLFHLVLASVLYFVFVPATSIIHSAKLSFRVCSALDFHSK